MNELLRSYLRNEITKSEFSAAICAMNGLESEVGRSRYLRLKHGDKNAALESLQAMNKCAVCSQLQTDDLAHSNDVRQKLDDFVEGSKIERVSKPKWYTPNLANKNPYGAQGFFLCKSCDSIIDVCESERMYRGCCEVIG